MQEVGTMTVHTVRDWRGIKVPVGRCTTDELKHMLAEAVTATITLRILSPMLRPNSRLAVRVRPIRLLPQKS